jgi:hypothetical protein
MRSKIWWGPGTGAGWSMHRRSSNASRFSNANVFMAWTIGHAPGLPQCASLQLEPAMMQP